MRSPVVELAEIYPQLYLDPDRSSIDEYKAAVLSGGRPDSKDLSHFASDERDRAERIMTPAGEALVVTLYDRRDFETFVRCMMAAKEGPGKPIPPTMGASTLVAFNWPRIFARKDEFLREQKEAGVAEPDWNAEFKRFTAVKENYIDTFIVLSRGPYSNVPAEDASQASGTDMSEEEWIERSDAIRKYHELTHFVCRKLFPDRIDAVWDELVADAAGIYAAFGCCGRGLEELFLGVKDGKYTGGRLENYLQEGSDMDGLASRVCNVLREFESTAKQNDGKDVFEFMLALEERQNELWQ